MFQFVILCFQYFLNLFHFKNRQFRRWKSGSPPRQEADFAAERPISGQEDKRRTVVSDEKIDR